MPHEGEDSWLRKLRPGRPLLEAWVISAIIVSISNVLAQFVDAQQKEVLRILGRSFTRWLARTLTNARNLSHLIYLDYSASYASTLSPLL